MIKSTMTVEWHEHVDQALSLFCEEKGVHCYGKLICSGQQCVQQGSGMSTLGLALGKLEKAQIDQ